MNGIKAYRAYYTGAEWSIIVIACSAKEAKKIAFKSLDNLEDNSFLDVRVNLIKDVSIPENVLPGQTFDWCDGSDRDVWMCNLWACDETECSHYTEKNCSNREEW